jgi:signal transduction histidine kinase
VPFEVAQLLDRTLQLLNHRAEEKKLTLTVHLDPDVPAYIEGDAFRLHQVLLNLLTNALKFTEQGQVVLRATLTHTGNEPIRIRFSVIDSGIGIPADQLEHIFDRFTQVDSASSRHHGGVGLGLTICKRLVGLMGGRMWAESPAAEAAHLSSSCPSRLQPSRRLTMGKSRHAGSRRPTCR